jgi:A/G-specific adenine glycosylase
LSTLLSKHLPASPLADLVVRWQKAHGRNNLPWQSMRDPYRVWLSEIMLQQTQVATVLGYYPRFLQRFPDVKALAAASLDDVLGLWSGLGYYSRARHLHRCAQEVMSRFAGRFPQDAATLASLPGIGRSTAAAIASLCFGERVAILDANVRRVVTRVLAFGEDLAEARHERALWDAAEKLLPSGPQASTDMPSYTQGMMDLGAMLCLPRKPQCGGCPVQLLCAAAKLDTPEQFPLRTRKLKRSSMALWLLVLWSPSGAIWLERRPAKGVWAGLHSLPTFETEAALRAAVPENWRAGLEPGAAFVHVLTHRDLHLHPCQLGLPRKAALDLPGGWVGADEWRQLGLPAPVRKLLEQTSPV